MVWMMEYAAKLLLWSAFMFYTCVALLIRMLIRRRRARLA